MTTRLTRGIQLPPSPHSPAAARVLLRTALAETGLEFLADVALLLTTELCSHAVRYAGTDLDLALTVDDFGLTVAVTDRGPGPLEFTSSTGAVPARRALGGHGLRRGDAMVIYTDGVTERRHGAEFFGRARLAELTTRLVGAPAATMAAALRTAAQDFSPTPPKDDIALLVLKAL